MQVSEEPRLSVKELKTYINRKPTRAAAVIIDYFNGGIGYEGLPNEMKHYHIGGMEQMFLASIDLIEQNGVGKNYMGKLGMVRDFIEKGGYAKVSAIMASRGTKF